MNDFNASAVATNDTTSIVTYLKGLWEKQLRIANVNPEDDFFALGGDSVLVIDMLVAVSAHFDRDFKFIKFFPKPTITTLTLSIQDELKANLD